MNFNGKNELSTKENHYVLQKVHSTIDDMIANGYYHDYHDQLMRYNEFVNDNVGVKNHLMKWVAEDNHNSVDFSFILSYSSILNAEEINFIIHKISHNDHINNYDKELELFDIAKNITENYFHYINDINFNDLYLAELYNNLISDYTSVIKWVKLNRIYARNIIELFINNNILSNYVEYLNVFPIGFGTNYDYFYNLFDMKRSIIPIKYEHFINYYGFPTENTLGVNI